MNPSDMLLFELKVERTRLVNKISEVEKIPIQGNQGLIKETIYKLNEKILSIDNEINRRI